MNASDDLKSEHDGILRALKILEKMIIVFETGNEKIRDDLNEMIGFFRLFADKCHHGKEEGILFPEMEMAGIANKNGPIGQMLVEHEEGRAYVRQMVESLNRFNPDSFGDAASGYIFLLRNHIEKENKVLFPMGDALISKEKQADIIGRFEKHEYEVMGEGIHEKLHETLDNLERKYLV